MRIGRPSLGEFRSRGDRALLAKCKMAYTFVSLGGSLPQLHYHGSRASRAPWLALPRSSARWYPAPVVELRGTFRRRSYGQAACGALGTMRFCHHE
jgi:hypothetical protein